MTFGQLTCTLAAACILLLTSSSFVDSQLSDHLETQPVPTDAKHDDAGVAPPTVNKTEVDQQPVETSTTKVVDVKDSHSNTALHASSSLTKIHTTEAIDTTTNGSVDESDSSSSSTDNHVTNNAKTINSTTDSQSRSRTTGVYAATTDATNKTGIPVIQTTTPATKNAKVDTVLSTTEHSHSPDTTTTTTSTINALPVTITKVSTTTKSAIGPLVHHDESQPSSPAAAKKQEKPAVMQDDDFGSGESEFAQDGSDVGNGDHSIVVHPSLPGGQNEPSHSKFKYAFLYVFLTLGFVAFVVVVFRRRLLCRNRSRRTFPRRPMNNSSYHLLNPEVSIA